MNPPCVLINRSRNTAIFVKHGTKHCWIIPMDSGGLTIQKMPYKELIKEWDVLPYDVIKAAEKFLNTEFYKTEAVYAILEHLIHDNGNLGALD